MTRPQIECSLWSHLPLILQSDSKESLDYILQTLWRTRKTGLEPSDRATMCDILHTSNQTHELDPLLVCLRTLIRKSVSEKFTNDDISNLFPEEVSPELKRLLTLLLQKHQREWQEDVTKDKSSAAENAKSQAT